MSRRVGIWADRRQYELENDFRIQLYGNGGNSEQIKLVPCPNMDTPITDAGLVHLTGLTKLQTLNLACDQITDAGLVHLKGLTNLERLLLYNTQVTDAGVAELKKALPNCDIRR